MAPISMRVGMPDDTYESVAFTKPNGEPRLPAAASEIIDQVISKAGLKPSSRNYFGLYKQMSPQGSLDWLDPTKPLTPETVTAASLCKLFFRFRFHPTTTLVELVRTDLNMAKLIHSQVFTAMNDNKLPLISNETLLQIGAFSLIAFVVDEFRKTNRRSSRTSCTQVLPFVDERCGYEVFLAQRLIDDYDATTLQQQLQQIIRDFWPMREEDFYQMLMHFYDTIPQLLGAENFQLR
eukprot:TRINITY_DN11363_c0_g1_i1.p2 TRINITY_DN11363_c0_g1~~TRINITY_DN11363_c0_g1_i1.p2  ORF type:complete len:236 (+),score=27.67 TRINITY_DN11363_c0_g1_i1:89-796(+)